MIKTAIFALTAAVSLTMTVSAQNTDNRPPIYPRYLDKQKFREAGLWFWVTEAPPTNIPVNYLNGDDKDSPQKRSFVCVGHLGSTVPIYCVNGPSERDDTLLMEAFLSGYEIGANPNELPAQGSAAARAMGMSDQELHKQLAEVKLQFDAVCAMNGGHVPAHWPVDPATAPKGYHMMSDQQTKAWFAEAQRRLDTVHAANGGQLPADWRERVAAMGPVSSLLKD